MFYGCYIIGPVSYTHLDVYKRQVLIRPSGTEPLVRVMIEGENQEEISFHATQLAKLIEERLQ